MAKKRTLKRSRKSPKPKKRSAGKKAVKRPAKKAMRAVKKAQKEVRRIVPKVKRKIPQAKRSITRQIIEPVAAAADAVTHVIATTAGVVTEAVHSVLPTPTENKPAQSGGSEGGGE